MHIAENGYIIYTILVAKTTRVCDDVGEIRRRRSLDGKYEVTLSAVQSRGESRNECFGRRSRLCNADFDGKFDAIGFLSDNTGCKCCTHPGHDLGAGIFKDKALDERVDEDLVFEERKAHADA
jgi:hypothetical protein